MPIGTNNLDTETYRTKLKTQDYKSLFDVKVRIFQKVSFNISVLEKKQTGQRKIVPKVDHVLG